MKKLALGFLAAGLIAGVGMANASTCTLAGNANAVAVSQIQTNLQTAGYTTSKTPMMHDCVYRVTAQDQSKKTWTLYFDPLTGNMIGKKS